MDRYVGGLQVEGRDELFAVDIREPLHPEGWSSEPIEGVLLATGAGAGPPFTVWARKDGDSLDGWSCSAVTWATNDNGESFYLFGAEPFAA